jgi:energy-coupling factor transporter transmembrane protein EcfT
MNNIFNINTPLLLQVLGIIFIGIGIVARLGIWKKWYWRSPGMVYSYIPVGVVFLLYGFNDLARERLGIYFWVYQVCYAIPVIVAVWWMVRLPSFVKPDWVRWVEAYPDQTYQAMQRAAQEDPSWESHVSSEQEVSAWAEALKKKHTQVKRGS